MMSTEMSADREIAASVEEAESAQDVPQTSDEDVNSVARHPAVTTSDLRVTDDTTPGNSAASYAEAASTPGSSISPRTSRSEPTFKPCKSW